MPPHLFLLQGGFAKCYELVDVDTNEIFAGKIVPKSMLTKPHQKDKVFLMRPVYNCITVALTDGNGNRYSPLPTTQARGTIL